MHPFRIKMNSGAVYLGFLDDEDEESWPFAELSAGCSMSYSKTEYRYDVFDIMDPCIPVSVNMDNVSISQIIEDDSVVAQVYCSYLGTWLAVMDENGFANEIPSFIHEYVERMNPRFTDRNGGVDIVLNGKYRYAVSISSPNVGALLAQIEKAKAGYSTPQQEKRPCESKVVTVDFGSKKP